MAVQGILDAQVHHESSSDNCHSTSPHINATPCYTGFQGILQRLFYNGRARNTIFVHAISNLGILQTIREQSSGKKGEHLDSDLSVILQLTQ